MAAGFNFAGTEAGGHVMFLILQPTAGTSLEDAVPETPEEFLYRLSRSRFGKGGVTEHCLRRLLDRWIPGSPQNERMRMRTPPVPIYNA